MLGMPYLTIESGGCVDVDKKAFGSPSVTTTYLHTMLVSNGQAEN